MFVDYIFVILCYLSNDRMKNIYFYYLSTSLPISLMAYLIPRPPDTDKISYFHITAEAPDLGIT